MSPAAPSREDVLDAFAVEPSQDRITLERYLHAYPQFAGELIDLSRELARMPSDHDLSEADHALIDKAHTKKADTEARQALWARVANEVLARTGDEARAIREANAAVAGRVRIV